MAEKPVVIITGASSGIGQNIAIELSGRGYAVVLCGRNKEGLETTSKQCQENGAQRDEILQLSGDLSDPLELERIVTATVERFGRIYALAHSLKELDGLKYAPEYSNYATLGFIHSICLEITGNSSTGYDKINNAGFGTYPDTLETVTAEVFESIFRVNIRAPVLLAKACMPYLEKSKGVIINISSYLSLKPKETTTLVYSMTKSAMNFFTESIACAYGPKGVRVCGILPGYIPTPMAARTIGKPLDEPVSLDIIDRIIESQLVKRTGRKEDVSKAVAYLLSEEASFITGENIVIDGGAKH